MLISNFSDNQNNIRACYSACGVFFDYDFILYIYFISIYKVPLRYSDVNSRKNIIISEDR